MPDYLQISIDTIGWLYTVAWSASFYPQVWLNYSRRSVTGLSFEYQAYNITGFTFYCIYCVAKYVIEHDASLGLTQSVEVNDLVFVIHAVAITIFIIYQCVIYKLKSHSLNKYHLTLVILFWVGFLFHGILVLAGVIPFINKKVAYHYSLIEYLGLVKVAISFVKYCPQAYMNWSRQSTQGWSIGNVLLDLSGGLLAFGQQALTAYQQDDSGVFTSNIAKLLLSLESVGFDLLFIVQHYVLYRKNNEENARIAAEIKARGLSREELERIEQLTQEKAKAKAASTLAIVTGADGHSTDDGTAHGGENSFNGAPRGSANSGAYRPVGGRSLNGSGSASDASVLKHAAAADESTHQNIYEREDEETGAAAASIAQGGDQDLNTRLLPK